MSVSISTTQRPAYHGYYAKNTVPAFEITADEVVTAVLTMQSHSFTASYAPDFNGKIRIDFGQLCGDYIETLMPNGSTNTVSQTSALITCVASFKDSQGNNIAYPLGYPWEWYVFNAVLKSATPFQTWVQTHFLTNQPLEKPTTKDSPEWLTWIDLDGSHILKVVFYPKEGGQAATTVRTDTVAGCFTEHVSFRRLIALANVQPSQLLGYYDLILYDAKNEVLCRQRYIYEERTGTEHYFCFVNALGGIDTLICDGENALQPEVTHNTGRFGGQYVALDDTDDRRQWRQQTGQKPHKWRNWLHELLSQKQAAALYDPEAGEYKAIVVTESELDISDKGQLGEASFSYILDDSVNAIGDAEYNQDRILHRSVAEQAVTPEDMDTETPQSE